MPDLCGYTVHVADVGVGREIVADVDAEQEIVADVGAEREIVADVGAERDIKCCINELSCLYPRFHHPRVTLTCHGGYYITLLMRNLENNDECCN